MFCVNISKCVCVPPLLPDTKQYPAFVGHKPGRNNTQRHRLDIQLITIMNRTLYIAARSVRAQAQRWGGALDSTPESAPESALLGKRSEGFDCSL